MPQLCFSGLHVMGIAADKAINRHADVSEQAKVVNQGCIPYPQQRGVGQVIPPTEEMQHQHSEDRYALQHF